MQSVCSAQRISLTSRRILCCSYRGTQALDLAGQAHLDDAVRRRRDAGDAIVIVGHDIGRLAAVADSATLLARGRVVAQGSAADTLRAETLTQAYGVSVSTAMAQGRRIYWSGE